MSDETGQTTLQCAKETLILGTMAFRETSKDIAKVTFLIYKYLKDSEKKLYPGYNEMEKLADTRASLKQIKIDSKDIKVVNDMFYENKIPCAIIKDKNDNAKCVFFESHSELVKDMFENQLKETIETPAISNNLEEIKQTPELLDNLEKTNEITTEPVVEKIAVKRKVEKPSISNLDDTIILPVVEKALERKKSLDEIVKKIKDKTKETPALINNVEQTKVIDDVMKKLNEKTHKKISL